MSGIAIKSAETAPGLLVVPGNGSSPLARHLRPDFDSRMRSIEAGRYLLFEGDPCRSVYYVADGWLSLSKSLEDGQTQIIDFAFPGETVAPLAADGSSSAVTIQALNKGAVLAIPVAAWDRLLLDRPELHRIVIGMDAAKRARRAERMLRLGKGTAEMRVAYALLEFCIRLMDSCDGDKMSFHIPMNQQQLGDFVGLSSVHVCRTMRRLNRNGLLSMSGHMDVHLHDLPGLAALAGVDCATLRREIVPVAS